MQRMKGEEMVMFTSYEEFLSCCTSYFMEISSDREAEKSFFCLLYRVSVSFFFSLFLHGFFSWVTRKDWNQRLVGVSHGCVRFWELIWDLKRWETISWWHLWHFSNSYFGCLNQVSVHKAVGHSSKMHAQKEECCLHFEDGSSLARSQKSEFSCMPCKPP